jgi:hypothetical protein
MTIPGDYPTGTYIVKGTVSDENDQCPTEVTYKLKISLCLPSQKATSMSKCFMGEVETNTGFVTLMYNRILGRNPDSEGLANQLAALDSGLSRAGLVYNLIFSEECQNEIAAYSNEEFIEFLYQAIFCRDADSGGLSNWLTHMSAGMTREGVVNGFIYSLEFEYLYL